MWFHILLAKIGIRTKRYQLHALSQVALKIFKNSRYGVIGDSLPIRTTYADDTRDAIAYAQAMRKPPVYNPNELKEHVAKHSKVKSRTATETREIEKKQFKRDDDDDVDLLGLAVLGASIASSGSSSSDNDRSSSDSSWQGDGGSFSGGGASGSWDSGSSDSGSSDSGSSSNE